MEASVYEEGGHPAEYVRAQAQVFCMKAKKFGLGFRN